MWEAWDLRDGGFVQIGSVVHTSQATYLIDHDSEAQSSWSDYSSKSKFRCVNDDFIVLHIKSSDGTLLHFVMDLCLCDNSDIVTSQKSPFHSDGQVQFSLVLSEFSCTPNRT